MKSLLILAFVVLFVLFQACDPDRVYDQFVQVDQGSWTWEEPLEFNAEISDTEAMYDIYLEVRHTTEYPMSNLYMFLHILSPEGQYLKDTVQMILAAPDGKWIGRGNGHIRELMLLYRKQTRFGVPGTYVFTLEQAMRQEALPVTDVGVRIERSNP